MQTVLEQTRSAAPVTSRRETHDAYHAVIARYGLYRVIICRDDHQWILQQRRGQMRQDGMFWHGVAYCTERQALIRLCQAHSGHTWPELSVLPVNFRKGGLA